MISLKIVRLLLLPVLFTSVSFIALVDGVKPVKLEAYDRIESKARDEVSGIVKSTKFENTFWVHGDSGTEDRIYAIDEHGNLKEDNSDFKGTRIEGAKNKDWEDIALGKDGTLIIADIGNNCYCRKDLKIFIVDEPDPDANSVEVIREIDIEYPREKDISSFFFRKSLNAEAVFMRNGKLHIISKNERGAQARLFRLDDPDLKEDNTLTLIDSFDMKQPVTGADISQDESQIAVLAKRSIWLFTPDDTETIFSGPIKWLPISGVEQVESIAFSGENLIIAEENGNLYNVPISSLVDYN